MKKKNFSDLFFFSLILPVILIVIWELACRQGMVNTTILPSPGRILGSLVRQITGGGLQKNIAASLRRVLFGYSAGAVLGIVLGTLMGLFPPFEKSMRFLIEILRPVPIIAWVPVLILWSGIGERSKIIVIAIGTFWSVLINVMDGIRHVDKKYIEVSTLFMKSRMNVIMKVVLPAASPGIFTGLRIGVGTAWISVIGAEMIAASSGLGFFISYSRELAQPANMLVGVFTIGVIGWAINRFLRFAESRLLRWNVNA
ncbi:MAG: ABC transporter permease [Synergistaceae bacterium]|jgi:sulfonate transport system permease protein|nr:ABC transporter permease [Synergistaceae bacterium]